MISNWSTSTSTATVFVHWSRRLPPTRKTVCSVSGINSEQLRIQLDHLHFEADNARAKANSARLRLLRLSEAAEKLQRQALTSVRTGKENDARDLLFQKKKVMQALEKSKSRIDLLDELSAKLNQAISVKETQLVSAVTLDLEAGKEEVSPPVRIVSPKEEGSRNSDEFEDFDTTSLTPGEHQESQVDEQGQPELSSHNDPKILEGTLIGDERNEANAASSLKGISSYEEFLEHLDQQLNNIEAELVTVLRFSTMVLEGGEKSKNLKLQQTEEILEAVCRIRRRSWTKEPANCLFTHSDCKYPADKSWDQIEIYSYDLISLQQVCRGGLGFHVKRVTFNPIGLFDFRF